MDGPSVNQSMGPVWAVLVGAWFRVEKASGGGMLEAEGRRRDAAAERDSRDKKTIHDASVGRAS